jgi:hypothetical protein
MPDAALDRPGRRDDNARHHIAGTGGRMTRCKKLDARALPGLVREAANRLRKGGWTVAVLPGRIFSFGDILAIDARQRVALLVSVAGPAKARDDVLPTILNSAAAKGWLTIPGNQLEVWRVHPPRHGIGGVAMDRQPVRAESLDRPDQKPSAEVLCWRAAHGGHDAGG